MELLTFGEMEIHFSVIGWLDNPLVQLKTNVVFTETKSMLYSGPPVMFAAYPMASEVPCGWITLIQTTSALPSPAYCP